MAAERVFIWFGILVVFLVVGGLLWLVYDSMVGTESNVPDVVRGTAGPVAASPDRGGSEPDRKGAGFDEPEPFRPRPVPARPEPGAVREEPVAAPEERPDPAADYGDLDDYLLSTKTPTFYGTVSGGEGPIPGARVVLLQEFPMPFGYKTVSRIKTDGRGQFVFAPQLVRQFSRYHLYASAPGLASQFYWNLSMGKRFDLRLRPGNPVQGKVVDGEDNGVEGAQVLGQGKNWREIVRSGADGKFVFEQAPAGASLKMIASADGFEPGSIENVAAGSRGLEIRLAPGVPVSGKVVDGSTKEPIANAVIAIGIPGNPDRLEKARTDQDGHYRLQGLPVGFTTFFARADRYSECMLSVKIERKEGLNFDFELHPAGAIRGQVVDESGNPVVGAKVFVALKNVFVYYVPDPNRPDALTDESGEFYVPTINANPGFDCKLVADHPDHRRGESGVLKPLPGETLEGIRIGLGRALGFEGKVVGPDSRPIPGAEVKVTSFSSQPMTNVFFGNMLAATPSTVTDEEGKFALRGITSGRTRVEVSAPDFITQQEMLEIPEEGLSGKVFTLERGFSIAGRVLDGAGKGIANARVHAACPHPVNSYSNAVSNQEGYYTVSNLKQGVFTLTVRAAGYSDASKEGVEAGTRTADFTLLENGKVSGLVTSAMNGAPVKEFTVNLMKRKPDGSYQWYRDFRQNTEDGRYECSDVEPGTYKVTVRTNEYAPRSRENVVVTSAGNTSGLNFVLTAGCVVFGKVTDAAGMTVKDAHVVAMPLDYQGNPDYQSQSRTERVKEDGTYRIRGLSDGTYQVKPMAGGYCQSGGMRLRLGGEQQFQVNLVLNKGGYVRVTVSDASGRPVSGAQVQVTDSAGNKWGATAGEGGGAADPGLVTTAGGDAGDVGALGTEGVVTGPGNVTGVTGEFRLAQPLCPGPATVTVTAPGFKPGQQALTILDEQEVPCRVVLRR